MNVHLPLFAAALLFAVSLTAAEPPRRNASASDPNVFHLLPTYVKPVPHVSGSLEDDRPDRHSAAAYLARPEVASTLRLTGAQETEIGSLFAEHAQDVTDLTSHPQTVAGEAFLQRLKDLSRDRDVRLLEVLDDGQRKSLTDIVERLRRKSQLLFPVPHVPEECLKIIGRIA